MAVIVLASARRVAGGDHVGVGVGVDLAPARCYWSRRDLDRRLGDARRLLPRHYRRTPLG